MNVVFSNSSWFYTLLFVLIQLMIGIWESNRGHRLHTMELISKFSVSDETSLSLEILI